MAEWHKNLKGNFTTFDYEQLYTVFLNTEGQWQVVHDDEFSRQKFETADEGMAAVESHVVRIDLLDFKRPQRGWRQTAKGGYCRHTQDGIYSVKQAKSGSWFVIVGGELLQGKWFDGPEEAQAYVDRS